jgi:hypothetical protein
VGIIIQIYCTSRYCKDAIVHGAAGGLSFPGPVMKNNAASIQTLYQYSSLCTMYNIMLN